MEDIKSIKFRGKNAGGWHYGLLTFMFGQYAIVSPDDENNVHLVDEETVGQYTTVADCASQDIYVDDIVSRNGINYRIIFETGSYLLLPTGDVDMYDEFYDCKHDFVYPLFELCADSLLSDEDLPELKVVGNIHDNPELLGEGADS